MTSRAYSLNESRPRDSTTADSRGLATFASAWAAKWISENFSGPAARYTPGDACAPVKTVGETLEKRVRNCCTSETAPGSGAYPVPAYSGAPITSSEPFPRDAAFFDMAIVIDGETAISAFSIQ